jgi:hypothetical protein
VKKSMGGSARFVIEKDEELSVYIKGAGGKGFTMHLIGPGYISVVRTKKEDDLILNREDADKN